MEEKKSTITRADFLKGSALAGLGAIGLSAFTACSPSKTSEKSDGASTSWDKEVEVLVVGSGSAAYAALTAAEAGTENVCIIDKGNMWGGTTATSGETLWIPLFYGGQEEGMADTREDALTYMELCAAGRGNRKIMEAYVDNANAMIEWTRSAFGWEWTAGIPGVGFKDYYEPYEGYRAHGRNANVAGDVRQWALVQEKLVELGVEILMETPATGLVVDENNSVIGVVAESGGKEMRIKAGTVVLGTGGFDHNPALVRSHQSIPIYVTNAVQANTGDGLLMGQAIGANVGNLDTNWGLPSFYGEDFSADKDAVYSMSLPDWGIGRAGAGSLIVNKRGERFANEASAYAVFNRAFGNYDTNTLERYNIPAVWIGDSNYALSGIVGQDSDGNLPDNIFQADTLDEIAEHFGIDKEKLNATVEAFNENALNGVDPVFGRGEKECDISIAAYHPYMGGEIANPALAPVSTPPFYASLYVPGTCGTNGGLKTNEFAQVLDTKDEVIENLYAVGNCAASFVGGQYCGAGMTIGAGAVMSYIGVRKALGLD